MKPFKNIYKEQPIIFITAHNESNYLIDAIELQVDGYISKPVDLEKLENKIKKLIEVLKLKYDLKQKELKIEEEKERFQLAIEGSNDGLWDWDCIVDEVYFSPKWKSILGYEEDEIESNIQEWNSRIHPEDIDEAIESRKNYLDMKTHLYESTHRLKHKNGFWIWTLCRGKALFDKDGKPIRMVGFHTDITKIKNMENVMVQSEKMAAMGEMIGNIAHQWRQPLSIISTSASGIKLEKDFGMLTEEKEREMLNIILETVSHLSKTIDDFRDFFKPDKEKKLFSLQENIAKALVLLSSKFRNSGITIIENIKDIQILGLENELIQSLMNILINAQDAFDSKELKKKFIFIDIYKEENNAVIKIKDNAGGIDNTVIDKIFEPYFTTKHKSQGTGIGLYMTYEIVKEHLKGTIEVFNKEYEYEGENYKGAEFNIYIPLN